MARKQKTRTLSDSDILTTTKLPRRGLLSVTGKGLVGAALLTGLLPSCSLSVNGERIFADTDMDGDTGSDNGKNADTVSYGMPPEPTDPADIDTGRYADRADTD